VGTAERGGKVSGRRNKKKTEKTDVKKGRKEKGK
jgi:hypothetical protein